MENKIKRLLFYYLFDHRELHSGIEIDCFHSVWWSNEWIIT